MHLLDLVAEINFIYLGFYVTFNTVQVISRHVVGRAEETSTYNPVRVVYCKLPTNGKQLPAFPLEAVPGTEPQGVGRQECYHSATVAPVEEIERSGIHERYGC